MRELIDRQEAIDALDCINGVEDVLRSLPPAQPEPQWIPVERELPEAEYPVIVTWMNNDPASYYQYILGKHYTGVAHYKNNKMQQMFRINLMTRK